MLIKSILYLLSWVWAHKFLVCFSKTWELAFERSLQSPCMSVSTRKGPVRSSGQVSGDHGGPSVKHPFASKTPPPSHPVCRLPRRDGVFYWCNMTCLFSSCPPSRAQAFPLRPKYRVWLWDHHLGFGWVYFTDTFNLFLSVFPFCAWSFLFSTLLVHSNIQ